MTDALAAARERICTEQVVVRVTEPQIALLRDLDDGRPYERGIGRETHELPGMMLDVCRRMHLQSRVERHGGPDGFRWVRPTLVGHEVLAGINAMDEAVAELGAARREGR